MPANLTPGQKLTLDVVGDSYGFYTLNLDGRNVKVKKFDFQRYDKTPARLQCIVDRVNGSTVCLKQDMAPIFAARYRQGEVYEFIVESDMTMTEMPHYKVTQEGLGYWIMLPARRNLKLSHGDRVRCRVGRIQGINLNLRIEEVVDRHGEPPMELVRRRDLAAHAGKQEVDALFSALAEEPRMVRAQQMYKDRNPEWILEALRAGREHIFSSGLAPDPRNVATLRDVAAYILEDTVLLGAFPAQRRIALRDEMARLVSYCDDMLTALQIVDEGRQSDYISDIMAKLSASGYLYRPESRLRTLMCIFALDPESIDAKMTDFIEIIHRGNPASWLAEPFRSAFVEQLQLYIDSCHTILDNISDIDGDEAERRLDKMLAALAIQQILASSRAADTNLSDSANDEMVVNRSRLYRYFTFKDNVVKTNMIEKAFQVTLSGDIPDDEFTWDDTKNLGRLGRRLLSVGSPDGTAYSFASPRATLSVSPSSLHLRISDPEASHSLIPNRLDLWHGLQVWLPDALPAQLRRPSTILQFRDAYGTALKALAAGAVPTPAAAKAKERPEKTAPETPATRVRLLPDPGELVDIIVEQVESGIPGAERFACRVVEDGYRGNGFLDRANLSRGNGPVPLFVFNDENGRPYRLKARVMSCSPVDDTLSFSLIDELNRFITNNVIEGDEVNGVVIATPSPENGVHAHRFTVLSEHGYTAWVDGGDFDENLENGSNILIRIDSVGSSGGRPEILATCVKSYVPERVTFEEAFRVLINSYANEQVYAPDGSLPADAPAETDSDGDAPDDAAEAGRMDEPLDESRVGELMNIIARLADLQTDMVKAYNYFWFARLIAEILGLDAQATYYARRCSIIEVLDEFASNGRVDLARVDSLSEMIIDGAGSSTEEQKLKLLAALDHPERTDIVWDMLRSTPSVHIDKLARLILAYNALDGFKLGRERSAIREQIYSELHLAPDILPEQIEGGRESQTVEFKTSLIYPAGNSMRRDIVRQTREIEQIIAGFLNTAGGRLYIGVSDEGYVRGVAQDLDFFKSTDKMDLHLMNAIDRDFKMVDRFRFIQSRWEEHDGKLIYIIDVRPTRTPIAFEGSYFQRHSTSTRPVPADLEAQFVANRRDARIPLSFVSGALPEESQQQEGADASAEPSEAAAATVVDSEMILPEAATIAPAPSAKREEEIERIATSTLRDNRQFDDCDGRSFHDPVSFFYITDDDGNYRLSPDNLWLDDTARLSLYLREQETEEDLLVLFASGHGVRLDYSRLEPQGRISGGEIVFLTPARPDDGLFVYYSTDAGRNVYKRFFPADSIRRGDTYEAGERLLPQGAEFLRAMVVGAGRASAFSRFERNGQKLSKGMADLDDDFARSLDYKR